MADRRETTGRFIDGWTEDGMQAGLAASGGVFLTDDENLCVQAALRKVYGGNLTQEAPHGRAYRKLSAALEGGRDG